MRLYYLTKLDTAKLILKERRMKLSCVGENLAVTFSVGATQRMTVLPQFVSDRVHPDSRLRLQPGCALRNAQVVVDLKVEPDLR